MSKKSGKAIKDTLTSMRERIRQIDLEQYGGPRLYAIQYDEPESYYVGMSGIGPTFGGTQETALIFNSAGDAAREMIRHWALSGAHIVEARWLRKDAAKRK